MCSIGVFEGWRTASRLKLLEADLLRHPAHECLVADLSAHPSLLLFFNRLNEPLHESVEELGAPPAPFHEIYRALLTFPTMNVPFGTKTGSCNLYLSCQLKSYLGTNNKVSGFCPGR